MPGQNECKVETSKMHDVAMCENHGPQRIQNLNLNPQMMSPVGKKSKLSE